MHVGSATVGGRLRPLDGAVVRLRLATPLPLRVGDRLLLRDPGARRVLGADVLDVDPPELRRRGAARARAAELTARPDGRGASPPSSPAAGSCGPTTSSRWAGRCPTDADGARTVAARRRPGRRAGRAGARPSSPDYRRLRPLEPGPPAEVLRRALDLPGRRALPGRSSGRRWSLRDGRVVEAAAALPAAGAAGRRRGSSPGWPPTRSPRRRRRTSPPRGWACGSWPPRCAAGSWCGSREGVVPRARDRARRPARGWRRSPQPFTLSQARQAWGTSRRVAVPLMEWLDARGVTVRLPDNTRRMT